MLLVMLQRGFPFPRNVPPYISTAIGVTAVRLIASGNAPFIILPNGLFAVCVKERLTIRKTV